jgi:large subunit ribosomal protein L4e
MANVLDKNGVSKGQASLPSVFSDRVRPELIRRAVIAENSYKLQPQGHYILAGMQTTAAYYGAMNSYRTGRHMGIAIRPRQKLGGGAQGDVRRIPSAVKGKRAHPHVIEKKLFEKINKKEYQRAIRSAVAATATEGKALIFSNDFESISKTKEVLMVLAKIGISKEVEKSHEGMTKRKGVRRSTRQRIYPRSILFVVSGGNILRSAKNLTGADTCKVENLTANLLAPGGNPGRTTIWTEGALAKLEESIKKLDVR